MRSRSKQKFFVCHSPICIEFVQRVLYHYLLPRTSPLQERNRPLDRFIIIKIQREGERSETFFDIFMFDHRLSTTPQINKMIDRAHLTIFFEQEVHHRIIDIIHITDMMFSQNLRFGPQTPHGPNTSLGSCSPIVEHIIISFVRIDVIE